MSKLVIFDLDGVLIDSRELHYSALNSALAEQGAEFVISREEHLSTYDGLNTTRKLQLLTAQKELPTTVYDTVWTRKQEITIELIRQFPRSGKLIDLFQQVKQQGYKIAVASNSIREIIMSATKMLNVPSHSPKCIGLV